MFRKISLLVAIMASLLALGFGIIVLLLRPDYKDHTITREGMLLFGIGEFLWWIGLSIASICWTVFLLIRKPARQS